MNLSEETIKHLEQKAFLRGLERALDITHTEIDELWDDCEQRSGACGVRNKLDEEIEKLSQELDNS